METPDTKALTVPALNMLDKAKCFKIANRTDYDTAGAMRKAIREGIRTVEEFFVPGKSAIDQLKKEQFLDPEKAALKPYKDADKILQDQMISYIEAPREVWPEAEGDEAVKLKGATEKWKCEVTDLKALVKHVAADPGMVNMVLANQEELDFIAGKLREKFSVPGCKAVRITGVRTV